MGVVVVGARGDAPLPDEEMGEETDVRRSAGAGGAGSSADPEAGVTPVEADETPTERESVH